MNRQPAVYILASRRNGTLYVGVTSNLLQRMHRHRSGETGGFASRHAVTMLVWFELHESMASAILREKQLKSGSRARKLALIENGNSAWRDLYQNIVS